MVIVGYNTANTYIKIIKRERNIKSFYNTVIIFLTIIAIKFWCIFGLFVPDDYLIYHRSIRCPNKRINIKYNDESITYVPIGMKKKIFMANVFNGCLWRAIIDYTNHTHILLSYYTYQIPDNVIMLSSGLGWKRQGNGAICGDIIVDNLEITFECKLHDFKIENIFMIHNDSIYKLVELNTEYTSYFIVYFELPHWIVLEHTDIINFRETDIYDSSNANGGFLKNISKHINIKISQSFYNYNIN